MSRRAIHLIVLALLVLATPAAHAQTPPVAAADAKTTFAKFLDDLWPDAEKAGVSRATFNAVVSGLVPDLSLPDLLTASGTSRETRKAVGQAEFTRPPQAYLSKSQLASLALQGRALAAKHAAALKQIQATHGVEPEIVLAIWGRETAFGQWKASHDVIRSLATLAWRGRRADLFRRELIFAMKMVEDGLVRRADLRGSWAGAMGLTQFMPSEFYGTAVALVPGRRPDLFNSIDDALASAAHQLKLKGWTAGQPWGLEIKLPATISCAREGVGGRKPLRSWLAEGAKLQSDRKIPADWLDMPVFLLTPAGTNGPAFLAFENFLVLKAYNFADLYALFVGNLADRIAGRPDFATPWAELKMLSTAELEQVQSHLKAAGEQIDKVDGKAGMNTRSSIGRYQTRVGIAADCWPSPQLLERLKRGT